MLNNLRNSGIRDIFLHIPTAVVVPGAGAVVVVDVIAGAVAVVVVVVGVVGVGVVPQTSRFLQSNIVSFLKSFQNRRVKKKSKQNKDTRKQIAIRANCKLQLIKYISGFKFSSSYKFSGNINRGRAWHCNLAQTDADQLRKQP